MLCSYREFTKESSLASGSSDWNWHKRIPGASLDWGITRFLPPKRHMSTCQLVCICMGNDTVSGYLFTRDPPSKH